MRWWDWRAFFRHGPLAAMMVLPAVLTGCSKKDDSAVAVADAPTEGAARPQVGSAGGASGGAPAPTESQAPSAGSPMGGGPMSPPPSSGSPMPGAGGGSPMPGAGGGSPMPGAGYPGGPGGGSPMPGAGGGSPMPGAGGGSPMPGAGGGSPMPGAGGGSPMPGAGYPGAPGGGGPPGYPGAGGAGGPARPSLGSASGAPAGYPGAPGAPGAPGGYPGAPGGYPGAPGAPGGEQGQGTEALAEVEPPEPKVLTFREMAEDAFAKGHEKDAADLIYAHLLHSDEEAAEYMQRIRWSSLQKQPQIAARIAVGVDLDAPSDVTSYSPVGTKIETGNRRGGGPGGGGPGGFGGPGGGEMSPGGGAPGGYPGASGAAPAASGNSSLTDTTGDMGKALVEHVAEIFELGQLGTAFAEVTDQSQVGGAASDSTAGSFGGGPGGYPGAGGGGAPPGYPGAGGGRPGAPGGFPGAGGGAPPGYPGAGGGGGAPPGYPGAGGAPGGFPGAGGGAPGGYESEIGPAAGGAGGGLPSGPAGLGGAPGFGGAGPSAPREPEIIGKQFSANPKRLVPGLTYLGTGDTSDLIDQAAQEGFDCIVIFEVKVEKSRVGVVQNNCKAKLYRAGEKKSIAVSDELNNVDVSKKMQKGEDDVIKKSMTRFLNKLDEAVALGDMPPAISQEAFKKSRLPTLESKGGKNPLATLAELKFWASKGFLTPEELSSAFSKVASGEAAGKLLGSDADARKSVLDNWTN